MKPVASRTVACIGTERDRAGRRDTQLSHAIWTGTERPNSDKDPLGQNVHWTDTAREGLGSSMYQGEDWLAWRIALFLIVATFLAALIIVGLTTFFAWAGGYA